MEDNWLPPVDRLISSFAGLPASASPVQLVDAARGRNRSLATLLSWWTLRGERLPDFLALELEQHRQILDRYTAVLSQVRRIDPAVVPAKGPSVCRYYPTGLLRQMADLDLLFPSAAGLWAAAQHLVDDGWHPQVMWAWRLEEVPSFHVELTRPSHEPMLMLPERVELTMISYQGDHVWRPPRLRTWLTGQAVTVSDCLLWLLDELGERPFRMRDLIDLAVLVHATEDSDDDTSVSEAAGHVARFGLERQLRGLCRQARRHYPEGLPILERIMRKTTRTRKCRRPWPLCRHPLSTSLSMALALTRDRWPEVVRNTADEALLAVQRRTDLLKVFERGTPLYGMPVGRQSRWSSGSDARLPETGIVARFDHDGAAWLMTPVGPFVLSLGPALREEWIHRAQRDESAQTEVSLA